MAENQEGTVCKTMAGTNYYLSPEIIQNKPYGVECDVWSLGVLLYVMTVGCPPFIGASDYEIYENVLKQPLHYPSDCSLSHSLQDLLAAMLCKNKEKRMKSCQEVTQHPFFKSIDFEALL